ncbi:hypothetical protein V6Z11_A10G000400 [Gossypium hirsutum]
MGPDFFAFSVISQPVTTGTPSSFTSQGFIQRSRLMVKSAFSFELLKYEVVLMNSTLFFIYLFI